VSTILVVLLAMSPLVVTILTALVTDDVKGWLPHIARGMTRSAARRLPPDHRERYKEEWLAELEAYSDRRLTALFRACWLWLGARAMKAALGKERPGRVPLRDRVVAAVTLVWLAPLLLGIALLIGMATPGPIFDRQLCVRPDGRRFHRLSFRTSAWPAALSLPLWALSLADLPCLVNVVRGDMKIPFPRHRDDS
jgi:hypothetical protein